MAMKIRKYSGKGKVGFSCGSFDLTHAGHYLMFKESRDNCDYLVIGLQTDPSIDRKHKNKPIQSLEERRIQLEGCKYIDEIIVYERESDLLEILKNLQPDVRFIGQDWKGKPFTGHELDIEVYFNKRDHNYSSSSLRKRICEQKDN
jgi:glycerol-3-phosphate cytidylyltransferase